MEEKEILKLNNISKRFIGVQALTNVSVGFRRGEIHALVGENGAGKSTLSKIISGAYESNTGNIIYKGKILPQGNPIKTQHLGIFMIPQDLGLIPRLSVMQNIYLGREKSTAGLINLRYLRNHCQKILDDIGIDLDLDMEVQKLSIDQQQFVAIARVLSANAELIILDEPTATLSESEVEKLFRIIESLKSKGITMIYISHRLDEIYRIADRVTILKDGLHVKTGMVAEITKDELIKNMVGRTLSNTFPDKRDRQSVNPILKLHNIGLTDRLHGIDLDVMEGEVLGIGGLIGMGQVSLLNVIYGSLRATEGHFEYNGERYNRINPARAIKMGITYISSDRRGEMLFVNRSVKENVSMSTLGDYQKAGVISARKENLVVDSKIKEYNIAVSNREQEIQFLSGGNQQKAILARWMIHEPRVLLLDEPTQGIDVGTKEDIYNSLRDLANNGVAIVVIFSDMNELLGMCDRIAVVYEGRLIRVFNSKEATEEKIMAAQSDNYKE